MLSGRPARVAAFNRRMRVLAFGRRVCAALKIRPARTVAAAVLLAALLLAAAFLRPVLCLVAECGGALLFAWPISEGEEFEVTFVHSLNLSPITDVIECSDGGMIVKKSVFKTFGAGVPTPSDGIGTELLFADGHYELIGIDKRMSGFTIMTQQVPDHRITFGGREARLLGLVGSGRPVSLAIKRVPWVYQLRGMQRNANLGEEKQ